MIKFKHKQAPHVPKRHALVADLGEGYECTVEPCDHTPWHAQIYVKVPGVYHEVWQEGVLIQGFGNTPEEAVLDAISRYLPHHRNLVAAIERLRDSLKKNSCNHNWLGGYCDLCGAVKPV